MSRILHIEDDPKNRRLVEKLLRAAGHEVIDAATGLEGIRRAADVLPALVLVDINVPDLDGYEVILRLRGMPALKDVPIVAITAEGDRPTSLAVGADGFLEKPIDAGSFATTVERFLRGHRERTAGGDEARLRDQTQRIVAHLEREVRQLEAANVKLEEMARLRREFLRNVTHELATPMTPVVGYLHLLLRGELGALNPRQTKCLEAVLASTERLRSVVDTLLDVSALETGRLQLQPRRYDFREVAGRALDEMRRTLEDRKIELLVEPGGRLEVVGDPDRIKRALVHVLDNAAKFSPDAGRVAVAARVEGAFASYLVADDGPGVPSDKLEQVLEPFFQLDGSVTRAYGGVGLGLAFSCRVAELMGGGVRLESPPTREIAGTLLRGTLVEIRVRRDGVSGAAVPTPGAR